MHKNHKIEERTIKSIVANNTKCLKVGQKLNIIFYYKNTKTANFVMKNNMAQPLNTLQKSNVVYSFQCPLPHCQAETYIGLTQTTLSRRLTMHGQDSSIYKHFTSSHGTKPTREQLTENTSIIATATDRYRLLIKEALLIMKRTPSINKQYDNFTNVLKLHAHRPVNLSATASQPNHNSGNQPKNSLSNTPTGHSNHHTNEPSELHPNVDTVLSAPILQEPLNILPSAPPIYSASDEIESTY